MQITMSESSTCRSVPLVDIEPLTIKAQLYRVAEPFAHVIRLRRDIICAENPAFERSSFGAWDFFIWGSLADFEALLQKPVKNEDDKCISKTLLKDLVFKVQDQISFFQQTIPHWITNWSPETSVRIIICEL